MSPPLNPNGPHLSPSRGTGFASCDGTIGPFAHLCGHGRFDFTLLFEQCFLALLPSILFILVASIRLSQLWRAKPVTVPSSIIYLKLVSYSPAFAACWPLPSTYVLLTFEIKNKGSMRCSRRPADHPARQMGPDRRHCARCELVNWRMRRRVCRDHGSYALDAPGTKTLCHSVDCNHSIPPRVYAL